MADEHGLRAVSLAYVDSHVQVEAPLLVEIRGKGIAATVVPFHLRSDAPPYARPILYDQVTVSKVRNQADSGGKFKG